MNRGTDANVTQVACLRRHGAAAALCVCAYTGATTPVMNSYAFRGLFVNTGPVSVALSALCDSVCAHAYTPHRPTPPHTAFNLQQESRNVSRETVPHATTGCAHLASPSPIHL